MPPSLVIWNGPSGQSRCNPGVSYGYTFSLEPGAIGRPHMALHRDGSDGRQAFGALAANGPDDQVAVDRVQEWVSQREAAWMVLSGRGSEMSEAEQCLAIPELDTLVGALGGQEPQTSEVEAILDRLYPIEAKLYGTAPSSPPVDMAGGEWVF